MSFKIAKPRVFDLRKGSSIVSTAEEVACGLCKKTQARYNCPSCNVPYCSLECFRGEEHRDCSEGFYCSAIEDEIRSAPDRTNEEKRGMMQILQRMADPEEEEGEGTIDSDEEVSELDSRLQSLDIESADADTLWGALTPAQQSAFTKAMKDPNSSLAQQLLRSLDSEAMKSSETTTPWWEREEELEHASSPPFIQVPETLLSASQRGWNTGAATLLYNVLCLCLSYTFCIRSLQIPSFSAAEPHDKETCRALLSQASQFLTDRKSATRLEDVDASIAYVQSRLKESVLKLLPDVSALFRPALVLELSSVEVISAAAAPCWRLLACLGDISSLYTTPSSSSKGIHSSIGKAIHHKLVFYAAHIMAAPTAQLHQIADKLARISGLEEGEDEIVDVGLSPAMVGSSDLRFSRGARGDPALAHDGIEEIN